jgi:membrane protein YdbS with pleckstrin-like domain
MADAFFMALEIDPVISSMLRPGEKVLWYGKPTKAVMTRTMLPFALFGLMMVVSAGVMLFFFMSFASSFPGGSMKGFMNMTACMFIPFILVSIVICAIPWVAASMLANNLHYAVTDRRLLTKGGIFGPGFQSTDYDKVQSVDVIVGFWDKGFGTGTVKASLPGLVYSGSGHYRGSGHTLQAVQEPYMVEKIILEAMEGFNKPRTAGPASEAARREAPHATGKLYCRFCGEELPTDSNFCDACGKRTKT